MLSESFQLRDYFSFKYQSKFGEDYPDNEFMAELAMLKRLSAKHSKYLILEAIDRFIKISPKSKAIVRYFSFGKVFESKFADLIKMNDVIKYQRLLPMYSKNDQSKIRQLIDEYRNYTFALSLTAEDVCRKKEIVQILEVIPQEPFVPVAIEREGFE